ncbi:MAG: sugar O-acetyltransferase [Vallitaleaceae bacterium]|nr:sugar O-acetyltransferase [Vallitaleaceae bacterium]
MFRKEEDKIFAGQLFSPKAAELKAIKLKTHNLCTVYNQTLEDQEVQRKEIIDEIFGSVGEGGFFQGPIYIHYGKHTQIGKRFFGNFNLIIQDDARVIIGDHCSFGPNVTIVTPVHPMLPDERRQMINESGEITYLCYAKSVTIGNDCWFGANVVICPGVTVGDNCVIGAGSVVVKDIPADSFAAGNPCQVIRRITSEDSMVYKPDILGENQVMD